jgi:hypothetical protein
LRKLALPILLAIAISRMSEPALSQTRNFELFPGYGISGPNDTTDYGASVLDLKASRHYECVAKLQRDGRFFNLTCGVDAAFSGSLLNGDHVNTQETLDLPPNQQVQAPRGFWQIDRAAGEVLFCLYAFPRSFKQKVSNCLTYQIP